MVILQNEGRIDAPDRYEYKQRINQKDKRPSSTVAELAPG